MNTSFKKMSGIAVFVIFLIVAINFSLWLFYQKTEKMLDSQLSRRLEAIANIASNSIDPMTAEFLIDRKFDLFIDVLAKLQNFKDADSLSEIFIIDPNYHYLVTTSLDEDSSYFLKNLNGIYIDSVFYELADNSVSSKSYRTGSTYLKSAFAPIRGNDGFPIAILGVEANVDYFYVLDELKQNLYYSSVLSILGGIIFGLLFMFYQRKLNHAEQSLFLSQTNSYLGRMVAVVSHEIKNPLMIIRASAERLFKKTDMDEGKFILEEVDRLNRIVSGYLDFARSGNNRAELINETCDTVNSEDLLSNLKKHLNEKFNNHHIEWINFSNQSNFQFAGYPRALRQVLLNLLINGAEACLDSPKNIKLGLTAVLKNGHVIFKVIDYGSGLSKKELKKVFEPFFTTKNSGSGLGLYLSKKIVSAMGGKINIESTINEKTEITITLPQKVTG